jgi:ketosteroid isomerase-like protein
VPIEENRAVARRVLDDLVSQGRFEIVDQIYAQAFEFRDPTAGQTITTYEGMRSLTRDIRSRTPDIAVVIEEEIAEGDAVVHRWTASGHDAGTGRFWTAPGISIYHLDEGRIVSEYVVLDRLGLLRQLGIAPLPGQPQPEEFDWASSSRASGGAGQLAAVPAHGGRGRQLMLVAVRGSLLYSAAVS